MFHHASARHDDLYASDQSDGEGSRSSGRRSTEVPSTAAYTCDECGHPARCMRELQQHAQTHNPVRLPELRCDQCQAACEGRPDLIQHMRLQHPELICDAPGCDHMTTSKASLKQHKTNHGKQAAFVCDRCDFAVGTRGVLSRHFKTGHGDFIKGIWSYKKVPAATTFVSAPPTYARPTFPDFTAAATSSSSSLLAAEVVTASAELLSPAQKDNNNNIEHTTKVRRHKKKEKHRSPKSTPADSYYTKEEEAFFANISNPVRDAPSLPLNATALAKGQATVLPPKKRPRADSHKRERKRASNNSGEISENIHQTQKTTSDKTTGQQQRLRVDCMTALANASSSGSDIVSPWSNTTVAESTATVDATPASHLEKKAAPAAEPVKEPPPVLSCAVCEYSTEQPALYIQHTARHERQPPAAYRCALCSYSSGVKLNIRVHLKNGHASWF